MIKRLLEQIISEAYPGTDFDILTPPDPKMGDYSVNLAFVLAKKEGRTPVEVGEELVKKFSSEQEIVRYFDRIEFVKPGFVNFHLSPEFLRSQVLKIIQDGESFGSGQDKKTKINLEFVSANPTGPLTVHNIRAAPYGDVLANVLRKAGYDVAKEYYINDAGNQVRILGESVARRYLRLTGKEIDFPENMYQGEYITDMAKEVAKAGLAEKIENFDELVAVCQSYAVENLIGSIKDSLAGLGVEFDIWFSEKSLHDNGEVAEALKILEKGNRVYQKDGATWLRLDESGDKDAVLVKSDGSYSYLMGDIAYTKNKFERGFVRAINIWGADHHGDVARLESGVKALGQSDKKLNIFLHQLVAVKSGGEKKKMSKRRGEFVLLDELLKEVGRDPIRFFLLAKDLDTHMEFDVDLAKEQSNKNPVFYIQYAYARLNSIFTKLQLMGYELTSDRKPVVNELDPLNEQEELRLMRKMAKFPELIKDISENYQVHQLAQYASELAGDFHNFYEKHRVVQDDKSLERARFELCRATAGILKNCLTLMGVSSPEKM